MENVHGAHKEDSSGWLTALVSMTDRIWRESRTRSRGLVVTPWSARSPAGWSA